MRRSSPRRSTYSNIYKSSAAADNTFTVISRLENPKPSKLSTTNIFRLCPNEDAKKKLYYGPSSGCSGGVKIYIRNENNITNYNTGCRKKPNGNAEPVIMPSFSRRPSEFKRNSMDSTTRTQSDLTRTKFPSTQTQRAMNFLKKDLLSNRNDFSFLKKPVISTLNNDSSTRMSSRTNLLNEHPVILEPQRQKLAEFSRHRPPPCRVKTLQSRQVQTDLPPLVVEKATAAPPQQSTMISTNTDSSLVMKKQQESSNFSMFKGMNSNDLYDYIDDVINEFRARTRIVEDDEPAPPIEFADTTVFYPDGRVDGTRPSKSINDRLNVHDLSTIMSSNNENVEMEGNFLESRSFSNTSKGTFKDDVEEVEEVEEESSTFINYTESFEIDDDDVDDSDTDTET